MLKTETLNKDYTLVPKLKASSPYFFALLAFFAVYGPTFKWLFDRWMMGVWYNAHGILIPFATGYLVWRRLRTTELIQTRNSNIAGLILLTGSLLLHVADTVIWSQVLSALSIVPAVVGLSMIFIGFSATKSIWLPLLLLVFMIPIPSAAIQPIVVLMRSITAVGASIGLQLIGVPLIRTGTYIEIPNGLVNVANACSGFATFSATLAFTAFLLWFFVISYKGMGFLLLTVLPVALAANIIRNIFLILISYYFGMQILETFWHPLSGYVMYLIAICIQTSIYLSFQKRKEER